MNFKFLFVFALLLNLVTNSFQNPNLKTPKSTLLRARVELVSYDLPFSLLPATTVLGYTVNRTIVKFTVKKESLQFGELEWLTDVGIFGEQFTQEALAAAEVPQLPVTNNSSSVASFRTSKSYMSHKKPRIEVLNDDDDDDEYFTVPDLG